MMSEASLAPMAERGSSRRRILTSCWRVARATRQHDVKILLLDEPLSAMGAKEASLIIELIRSRAAAGVSMIVVDHNYSHIFELCDRVNVIQQGRVTLDKNLSDTSVAELTEFMVEAYRRDVEAVSGHTADA